MLNTLTPAAYVTAVPVASINALTVVFFIPSYSKREFYNPPLNHFSSNISRMPVYNSLRFLWLFMTGSKVPTQFTSLPRESE